MGFKSDHLKLHRKIAEAIINRFSLKNDWRCLDFGCGAGLMSFLLADRLGQIDCIDTSSGMIQELNKKLSSATDPKNISTHCRLLDKDTFEDNSFDFLFTILALHHVEDVKKMIRIFGKIVKSGGHIALIDLDKEDGSFHQATDPGIYHKGFGRDYIQKLLRAEAFEEIIGETAAFREREHEDGSRRSYPVFMISGRKI